MAGIASPSYLTRARNAWGIEDGALHLRAAVAAARISRPLRGAGQIPARQTEEPWMAHEKRFQVWKRHHRRRKSAKAKMKEYEAGRLAFDKLPALAKSLLRRKRRSKAGETN
jgi:hypothetical protein